MIWNESFVFVKVCHRQRFSDSLIFLDFFWTSATMLKFSNVKPDQRCYGQFVCGGCHHKWISSNAWLGFGQGCQECGKMVMPNDMVSCWRLFRIKLSTRLFMIFSGLWLRRVEKIIAMANMSFCTALHPELPLGPIQWYVLYIVNFP